MNELDEAIEKVAYILDALKVVKKVQLPVLGTGCNCFREVTKKDERRRTNGEIYHFDAQAKRSADTG